MFGVNEIRVRDWREAEATLAVMKKTKKANHGLKARWPQLEERVCQWVLEQRATGKGLSTVQPRLHAQGVAKAMNIKDFLREDLLGSSASCNATPSLSEHGQRCPKNCQQISKLRSMSLLKSK